MPTASGCRVALRKESVDRNKYMVGEHLRTKVALRKESVDRNSALANILVVGAKVALRKESVDRNRKN